MILYHLYLCVQMVSQINKSVRHINRSLVHTQSLTSTPYCIKYYLRVCFTTHLSFRACTNYKLHPPPPCIRGAHPLWSYQTCLLIVGLMLLMLTGVSTEVSLSCSSMAKATLGSMLGKRRLTLAYNYVQ